MKRLALAAAGVLAAAALAAAQQEGPARPPEAAPAPQLLGPIVGHVEPDRALLWLRAPGVRSLEVTVDDGPPRQVPFEPVGRGFGVVPVEGLTPEREQRVLVAAAGYAPAAPVRVRTPPRPRPWGTVRFGVGSCAAFPDQPVWDAVAAADLDLFLWLGDNTYYRRRPDGGADWDRLEWMLERQVAARQVPNLLAAMRGMACYGTWDDHDYGPNNADRHFALRAESRLVHRYLWAANPGCGEDGEGVYFSFRRGPAAFFVLDDRSFKDCRPELPPGERRLYGDRQLAWLRRELRASDAPLKVVASGVQQLLGYPSVEGWHQAPAERAAFLAWAAQRDLGPLLFLSGDVHVSELYEVPLAEGRIAWELTSSGLAQTNRFGGVFEVLARPERRWVVNEPNFCVVEVDVPRDPARLSEASVVFRCLSAATGEVLQETRTTFASFGGASPPPGERPTPVPLRRREF